MKTLLTQALSFQKTVTKYRRILHNFAECGFDLPKTRSFVKNTLQSMGYQCQEYGHGGIVCETNGNASLPCILLRADMDALPMQEKTTLPFRAENGCMHACGHDMHTAMLLLCARLLKEREALLPARVRFVFQAAEETLSGARILCDAGVTSGASAALMLHVIPATDLEVGTLLLPQAGIGAPAARFFSLTFTGKSAHVGEAHRGKDAIDAAITLYTALHEEARRYGDALSLAIGVFQAGSAPNVVAERALLSGSFRSSDEDKVTAFAQMLFQKAKEKEAETGITATPRILGACPPLVNDIRVVKTVARMLDEMGISYACPQGTGSRAAEDFAHIAKEIPAAALAIGAGKRKEGYAFPLHHPSVLFDEDVLPIGAAVYAGAAYALGKEALLQTFTKAPPV